MYISVCKKIVNKPAKNDRIAFARLTTDFENKKLSQAQVADVINRGWSITTWHKDRRKQENFLQGGYIGLDFDNAPSVEAVMTDPFIQKYHSIFYFTASSTPEAPRFRLIFELETPITDANEYRKAVLALLWKFGQEADKMCKDPCRIFYGSKGSNPTFTGHYLPDSVLNALISEWESFAPETELASTRPEQKITRLTGLTITEEDLATASQAANGFLKACREASWRGYGEWQKKAAQALGLDLAFSNANGFFWDEFCRATRSHTQYDSRYDEEKLRDFATLKGVSLSFAGLGLEYNREQKRAIDPKNPDLGRYKRLYEEPPIPGDADFFTLTEGAEEPKKISGRRRRTCRVELTPEEIINELSPAVELDEARLTIALAARDTYIHPNKARLWLRQIAAQPGVGKGHAFNQEATYQAYEGRGTTAWFSHRKDQFFDQERPLEIWKQIIGRQPARDAADNLVDFCDDMALEGTGNCTVEGEAFHRAMGEKGWQKESHKYCDVECPVKDLCKERGYMAQLEKDGRNAHMSFEHLFTTLGGDHRFVTVDEPSYHSFVDIRELKLDDITYLRKFVFVAGMNWIIRALIELMSRPSVKKELDIAFDEVDGATEAYELPLACKLDGPEFYREWDKVSREINQGRGLLELLDMAKAADSSMGFGPELFELLAERSAESAQKLPYNVWKIPGAEPGAGGIFDIMLEEVPQVLSRDGETAAMEFGFVSRLSLIREKPTSEARLVLYRRRYLHPKVATKPLTVLDATGDENVLRTCFTYFENLADGKEERKAHPIWRRVVPQIQTVAPRVEIPETVKIVQDTRCNFSKTSLLLSLKKDQKYWNRFTQSVSSHLAPTQHTGKRTLIVCSSAVEEALAKALIETGYTEANGYQYAIEHYGNLRGSNAYQDYDRLIQAGAYMPSPESVIGAGRALYGSDGQPLNEKITRLVKLHNLKGDKAEAWADEIIGFEDERLQRLLEVDREDEHLQVAYRIRPLTATTEKEIILLFATPVKGLVVSELVTEDENKVSARSQAVIDKMLPVSATYLAKESNPIITAQMLAEESGVAIKTVYKYFKKVMEEVGGEAKGIWCYKPLPNGNGGKGKREALTSFMIGGPVGIVRRIINIYIIFGEMPTFLPKGWRIAPIEDWPDSVPEMDDKAIPLEVPENIMDVPRVIRGETSARLSHIKTLNEQLRQCTKLNFEAGAIFSQRQEAIEELNRLLSRHAPRQKAGAA